MNAEDKPYIDLLKWVNENYESSNQFWTLNIGQEKDETLTNTELYNFYKWLKENYYWKEEPGYWYHKNPDLGLAFTLKEIYKLYSNDKRGDY